MILILIVLIFLIIHILVGMEDMMVLAMEEILSLYSVMENMKITKQELLIIPAMEEL